MNSNNKSRRATISVVLFAFTVVCILSAVVYKTQWSDDSHLEAEVINPHFAKAFLTFKEGDYNEVIRLSAMLMEESPESYDSAILRGDAETRLHLFESAATSYEEAIRRMELMKANMQDRDSSATVQVDRLSTEEKLAIVKQNREWTMEEIIMKMRRTMRNDGTK